MKAPLLTLLAAITLTLTGCVAGPYDASYSYQSQSYRPAYTQQYVPAHREYHQAHHQYQPSYRHQQVTIAGPQYYRVQETSCRPTRYKNYSDAPIIVERPGGNIIIPQSWD